MVYETLMESQDEQILGIVHIGDFTGATSSHVGVWRNPVEFLKLMKWGEQSLPLRHKAIHLYNVATFLKYVVDAAKSITTNKMRDRLRVRAKFEYNFQFVPLKVICCRFMSPLKI